LTEVHKIIIPQKRALSKFDTIRQA